MAKNLRAKIPAEDTLVIFDINRGSVQRFCQEPDLASKGGLTVANDIKEVVNTSDTVITMLPEPQHVKSVFDTILSSNLAGRSNNTKLFVDCSTIDIATSLEVGKAVRDSSSFCADFVDAPVSGGVVGAQAGTLTFMVGSHASTFPIVTPLLSLMGNRILHCGPPGSGLAGKLSNNYLLAISNIATAEAMNLGISLGLDKKVLKDLINVSSGRCWSSEVNNPVDTAIRGFQGGFGVSLMKKDLKLAIKAAEEVGARLELGVKARTVYESVENDDHCRGKDFSVVYRWLGGREGEEDT
ncbi:hypothetical protein P167DRAFT_539736 [Morchella conica CCBAS932]|uniref:3-hydroxyisobutyrate dehydrogenase n=1 Tax=Morchella conica CCBAS932 TaxID=1392247 RepID=A0A3N4KBT0_9PEZI|nr:hypothetical protein P167DRAFT_539736 [Morchella conica CCBAS932]